MPASLRIQSSPVIEVTACKLSLRVFVLLHILLMIRKQSVDRYHGGLLFVLVVVTPSSEGCRYNMTLDPLRHIPTLRLNDVTEFDRARVGHKWQTISERISSVWQIGSGTVYFPVPNLVVFFLLIADRCLNSFSFKFATVQKEWLAFILAT